MANDFNKIIVSGRLGGEPEMRYTESGMAVTTFNIANGQYDRNAENNELTTWYRVSIFGKRAEAANQYLNKGSKVLISGAHRIRKYTDKEGNERQSNEITADDFTFMGGKGDTANAEPAERPAKPAKNAPQPVTDDDLPF
jgi:single-strand DNA-binding protein